MNQNIELNRTGDGIAELFINRPEKLNAITPDMARAIRDARREINDDEDIRVVILHSAGDRAFSAGTDLKAIDEYGDAWAFRNRICYATEVRKITKPTIAALKGYAVGGGLEIAINCDIRIADPTVVVGAPEVRHGWLGGGGQTQMLERLVGYGKAMMICLTGDQFGAEEAYRLGIVEKLVAKGEELAAAREMAGTIASHTTVATMTVKEGIRAAMNGLLDGASRYENDLMILAFALGNQKAGIEKFRGRKD